MSDLSSTLIEEYLLAELVAEGWVEKVQQAHIFHGNDTEYLIEIRALPIRKKTVRLTEEEK